MGSLSDYAENKVLDHLAGTAYTPAATIYLALATADPTDAGTGASFNEVANSGSYARTAIAFGASSSRRVTQSGTVTFPQASGSWGTVTHWAIIDTNTYGSGNILAHGAFGTSKSIVSGNTPSVATSEVYVEITASTGMTNYGANGILDRIFRNQALTVTNNYAALWTTTLVDASTGSSGTEASGGSYARKQINASGGASPAWNAAASGALTNANAVTFVTATGSWGTITYMAIVDASTTGNMLWYGSVTSQAVASGDTVSFASSAISISQS